MRTMARRLARIENKLAHAIDLASDRLANLLREKRQRRLEAAGIPFDNSLLPDPRPDAPRMSVAETLHEIRQTRLRAAVGGYSR